MGEPEDTPEDEAFWSFSLAFYERPGVAEALITLQDRDGFDVNLILFALWLGVAGRGALDSDLLKAAERAAGTLRDEIVEPLRILRRKLRHHPDGDVQQLRDRVKALELEGEKLVQRRLAHLAGPVLSDIPTEDRLAAAEANLVLYLGPERARSAEAIVLRETVETFVPTR